MKRLACTLLALLLSMAAHGAGDAQTLLHLLDYLGVDYAGAVDGGRVKGADEYREMREFSARIVEEVGALGPNARQAALRADAKALAALVDGKADAAQVAAAAGKLRWAVVQAYGVVIAPRAAPDLAKGRALFAQQCASCHGATGHGDGPLARTLEPKPADFHDAERMAKRSAYGLYSTISLGVAGTSMPAFKSFSEDDRWALAFHVAGLRTPAQRIREDEAVWQRHQSAGFAKSLEPVATLSPREFAADHGTDAARVQEYLIAHPEVLKPSPLPFTRARLAQAQAAYREGRIEEARKAALGAYLEGYELVEASLANVDADLMRTIEREMLDLRAAVDRREAVGAFDERIARTTQLLAQAEQRLSDEGLSPAGAFASAFLILLREGLEAILVLSAIIAFVAKSGRRDALPWVHGGWIAALALGVGTWGVASYVIDISGAHRELTEGITALVAAAMLLYVGYWLHGKAYAAAWAQFIRDRVGAALGKATLGSMAAVSFLAVYREIFEVVLFYQALWAQAGPRGGAAVIGGAAAAIAALAAIGFAILRYSIRLPIGPFFNVMSALLALLAVVFAGNGVAALQEAGVLDATRVAFATVPLLGIHPTLETLGAQGLALVLALALFMLAKRGAARAAVAAAGRPA